MVEEIFIVAVSMQHLELGWIKKSSAVDAIERKKIPDLFISLSPGDVCRRGAKRCIAHGNAPKGAGDAKARLADRSHSQAGFVAKLRRGNTGDYLHRLHGVR